MFLQRLLFPDGRWRVNTRRGNLLRLPGQQCLLRGTVVVDQSLLWRGDEDGGIQVCRDLECIRDVRTRIWRRGSGGGRRPDDVLRGALFVGVESGFGWAGKSRRGVDVNPERCHMQRPSGNFPWRSTSLSYIANLNFFLPKKTDLRRFKNISHHDDRFLWGNTYIHLPRIVHPSTPI